MADEQTSGQERSESATPRRREEARQEGRVARSHDLSAAAVLLIAAMVFSGLAGRPLFDYTRRLLRECAGLLSAGPIDFSGAVAILRMATLGLLLALMPFALAVAGTVVGVNLVQTRGLATWKPLVPNFSRIDPVAGLRRIFSLDALFNLLKSLVKLVLLAWITYAVISRSWPELSSLVATGPSDIAAVIRVLAIRLVVLSGLAFLVVAGADYAFQRFQMEKSLRMTKQEVIYEHRETEGDPHVKARIHTVMRALARRRMLHQVRTADVVVVNPTEIAVALRYDTDVAPAPIVVAMGQRKLAERIRELARKASVPIVENRPVARALLATGKINRPIPPALYAAVAEILAFVYRQRAAASGGLPSLPLRRTS